MYNVGTGEDRKTPFYTHNNGAFPTSKISACGCQNLEKNPCKASFKITTELFWMLHMPGAGRNICVQEWHYLQESYSSHGGRRDHRIHFGFILSNGRKSMIL